MRKFAADQLGDNVGGAYKSIAPVDQNAVVYVVMAAPRDSLTPYTWWFPIVGRVPYRGYFDKNDALAEAASLEAQGLDTMVRPAVAFSSLGFFNDPLLTNLLKLDRVELAGVLIHELFHRTYYLASDAMFDESAANYVGSAGAVAFFAATDGESAPSTKAAREHPRERSEVRALPASRAGAPAGHLYVAICRKRSSTSGARRPSQRSRPTTRRWRRRYRDSSASTSTSSR